MFFWDWTYFLILPGLLLGLWAQAQVKGAYAAYSRKPTRLGRPACEVVDELLRRNGNDRVRIARTSGQLTDHYNPADETLNLSEGVYGSASVAALGIAAHEAGHAMQKLEGYAPLRLRSAVVPVVNIGSSLSTPLFILGLIFSWKPLVTVGIVLFSLSVLFAYKVGLFNIGAAGQYVMGAGASLYCALAWHLPWYVCMLAAVLAGALWGAVSGALKAYRNVNEVISCIMLNWIGLYLVNTLLSAVKDPASPYTLKLNNANPAALIPSLGLGQLFSKNRNVTIAIPLAIIIAVVIWVLLNKTRLGYELKATGLNKNAARYSGMREKYNTILTMAIAGALAGLGAAMFFLSGFEEWAVTQSAVPAMGFNGIAAAFLGGLHPIGALFSSFFIQHITAGGAYIDMTMYSSQISDFISAMIIYLCGFVLFFKHFLNRWLDRRDEMKLRKEAEKK